MTPPQPNPSSNSETCSRVRIIADLLGEQRQHGCAGTLREAADTIESLEHKTTELERQVEVMREALRGIAEAPDREVYMQGFELRDRASKALSEISSR